MSKPWHVHLIDRFSQSVYDLVIPRDHFLCRVNQSVDLSFINALCAETYKASAAGRRAEAPEVLFRALLLMILYQIPFETVLVQEIRLNLAYRWFCGLGIGERVFDHSLFYVVRKRLGAARFEQILTRIVEQCVAQNLIGNEWAFYDTTAITAAATRYSPYERAVIIARALIRLLEQPAQGEVDPTQPPAQARPALQRHIAELAYEVVGAKAGAQAAIVEKVMQLSTAEQAVPASAEILPPAAIPAAEPHDALVPLAPAEPRPAVAALEQAAQGLATQAPLTCATEPAALRAALAELHAVMPRGPGDPDARFGRTSKGGSFYGYWSGTVVDGKHGVITATHLEPGDTYAPKGLTESPVIAQHVARTGAAPTSAALDAAFDDDAVRTHCANLWPATTVYIHPKPLPRPPGGVFGFEQFTLTANDEVRCPYPSRKPEETVLRLVRTESNGTRHYVGRHCAACPWHASCTTSPGPRTLTVNPEAHRARVRRALEAQSPEHRAALKRRFAYAEAPFGHGKRHHRWGKAAYQSIGMNRIFNVLVVIAHDIEKLVRYAPARGAGASQ